MVIHLAAKVGLGVDLADIDDYARQNDLGTAVVLRAAAEAGVRRVVYASSMVVYGEGALRAVRARPGPARGPRGRPIWPPAASTRPARPATRPRAAAGRESAPLDPRNVYAATKVHGEHLAAAWAGRPVATVAALRFHNVYGPGLPRDTPYAGVAALFVSRLAAGEPPQVFEDGRQRRNFVHVDDVAAAVVAALAPTCPTGLTALNIGSGRVTTIGEMAPAARRRGRRTRPGDHRPVPARRRPPHHRRQQPGPRGARLEPAGRARRWAADLVG